MRPFIVKLDSSHPQCRDDIFTTDPYSQLPKASGQRNMVQEAARIAYFCPVLCHLASPTLLTRGSLHTVFPLAY